MRDVFIVPGVPATRTVLPFGMPPPRTRSRPSTYVWRMGTSSSMSCVPRNPRYKAVASPLSGEIFLRALCRTCGYDRQDLPRVALHFLRQVRHAGLLRTTVEPTTCA